MYNLLDHIAASATGGDFSKSIDEVLEAYSAMGYKKFEVYTGGRGSSLNLSNPPEFYLEKGRKQNLSFSSLHLSVIEEGKVEDGMQLAIKQALYAKALKVKIVIFKAHTKEIYIKQAKIFLDAMKGHGITTVIQIHEGGAFNNLEDLIEVFSGIDDQRMKLLLEVGTLHAFGIPWKQACDVLGERIALVHVKDMIGTQCVPFGNGEIDIPGLFMHMKKHGYEGDFVVEIDPKDKENTRGYIKDALDYIRTYCT